MIFATPEFGSEGLPCYLCLLFVLSATLYFSARVVSWGRKISRKGTPSSIRLGVASMVLGSAIPVVIFLHPALFAVERIKHGNSPLGGFSRAKISEGMTSDEVKTALGNPQDQHGSGDREVWYYWTDPYGLGFVAVRFESQGRVTSISED